MAVPNIIDRAINLAREAVLTPEEQAQRENRIQKLEMIRTATVATMVVAPIFIIMIPKTIIALFALSAVVIAKEIFSVASNLLEMTKNARIDLQARTSRDELIHQICKNTIFSKSLIHILNPSFEELLQRIDRLE